MKRARKNAPITLDIKSLHALIDPIEDHNRKTYAAACWYAENQIMIVPFAGGYPKGLSQRHATNSLKKIKEWWHPEEGKYPGASIAMAHGGQAGYCAVDLDVKGDVSGIEKLADLQMAYGSYDDGEGEGLQTLMASTPSGGRHLIFRYHPEIISNSEVSYAGIDTRGGLKKDPIENGGITFVEPSKKKGVDGFYRWDDTVQNIQDIPQWLVDVLNGRTVERTGGLQLQDAYIESAPGLHGDGRDRNIYMDLMRFAGIGYTAEELWGLMPRILERMDPPDELMVKQKIESVINSEAFSNAKEEKKVTKQIGNLKLIRDEKDRVIKSAENLVMILNWAVFEHEYGLIEYDDFSGKFVCDKKPMNSIANWAVGVVIWISTKLKLDFPVGTIRETIEYMAYSDREHINLARDYMIACPRPDKLSQENFWGSGRRGPGPAFERLCSEVLDLNNKNLHPGYDNNIRKAYKAFLWFWMQGVVGRACVPGCKMEIVLNIFGDQGIGKSLFFRDLCPDPAWFTDSIQDSIAGGSFNNRDELLKLQAKIIIEMPELSPIKKGGKSADNKMKQFISAQVDNYRQAYGHDSMDHPRTCALCGTSNETDIYRDASGARRFVSINHANTGIRVGDLDSGVLQSIRDQLWGELVYSFNKGELSKPPEVLMIMIPKDLRSWQAATNSTHKYEEIGIVEIVEWMQDKTRVTWSEVVHHSKSLAGLRDAKEGMIMSMVRTALNHDSNFAFKRGLTHTGSDGKTSRNIGVWVNSSVQFEQEQRAGVATPPHWSTYAKGDRDDEPPEY